MQPNPVSLSQLITQDPNKARELLANKLRTLLLSDEAANTALLNKFITTLANLPDIRIVDLIASIIDNLLIEPAYIEHNLKDKLLPNLCHLTAENIAEICNCIVKFVNEINCPKSFAFINSFAFFLAIHMPNEFPELINKILLILTDKDEDTKFNFCVILARIYPRAVKLILKDSSTCFIYNPSKKKTPYYNIILEFAQGNPNRRQYSPQRLAKIFTNSQLIDLFETKVLTFDRINMLIDSIVDFFIHLIANNVPIDVKLVDAIKNSNYFAYALKVIEYTIINHPEFPKTQYYLLLHLHDATEHFRIHTDIYVKKLINIITKLGEILLVKLREYDPIYTFKSLFYDVVRHICLIKEPTDAFFAKIKTLLNDYLNNKFDKNILQEEYQKLFTEYGIQIETLRTPNAVPAPQPTAPSKVAVAESIQLAVSTEHTEENQKLLTVIRTLIDHESLPLNDLKTLKLTNEQKSELLSLGSLSTLELKRKVLNYFAPSEQLSVEDVERLFGTRIIIISKLFAPIKEIQNEFYRFMGVYHYSHNNTRRERTFLNLTLSGLYFLLLTSHFFHKFAVENQPQSGQMYLHGRFDYSHNLCLHLDNSKVIPHINFIVIPRLTELEDFFKSPALITAFFRKAHFTQHSSLSLARKALYYAFNNIERNYSHSQQGLISEIFYKSSLKDFAHTIKTIYGIDIDIVSADLSNDKYYILTRNPEYQKWLNILISKLSIYAYYGSYEMDYEKIGQSAQAPAPKITDPSKVSQKDKEMISKYDPCLIAIQHYFLSHFNFKLNDENERAESIQTLISAVEMNLPLLTAPLIKALTTFVHSRATDLKESEKQLEDLKQKFPFHSHEQPQNQPFVDNKIFLRRCSARTPYEVELSSLIANPDYFKPVTLVIKDAPKSPINLPAWQDQPMMLLQCDFNSTIKGIRVCIGAKKNIFSDVLKNAKIDLNTPQETIEEILKCQIKTTEKNASVKFLTISEMEDKCQEIYLRYKGIIPDISTTELANQFYLWTEKYYTLQQQQIHINLALETFFLECSIHECVRNALRNCLVKHKLMDLTVDNFLKSIPDAIKTPKKSKPYKDNLERIVHHNEILMQLDLDTEHQKDKLAGIAFCGFSQRAIKNVLDFADAVGEIFGRNDIEIYYYDYQLGQFIAFSRERLMVIKSLLPETFYPENPHAQHATLSSGDIQLPPAIPTTQPKQPNFLSFAVGSNVTVSLAGVSMQATRTATGFTIPPNALLGISVGQIYNLPYAGQNFQIVVVPSQDNLETFLATLVTKGFTVVPELSRPPAERDKHKSMVENLPAVREYLEKQGLCIVSLKDLTANAALTSQPSPANLTKTVASPSSLHDPNAPALPSSVATASAVKAPPVKLPIPPNNTTPSTEVSNAEQNKSGNNSKPGKRKAAKNKVSKQKKSDKKVIPEGPIPAAASLNLPLQAKSEEKGTKRSASPTSIEEKKDLKVMGTEAHKETTKAPYPSRSQSHRKTR